MLGSIYSDSIGHIRLIYENFLASLFKPFYHPTFDPTTKRRLMNPIFPCRLTNTEFIPPQMLEIFPSDDYHFLAFRQFAYVLFRHGHLLADVCCSYLTRGDGLLQGIFGNSEPTKGLVEGNVARKLCKQLTVSRS